MVGQGRFGVKIASLISYLRTMMRIPVRQIQSYLATLHGLSISGGEIIGLARRVITQLEPELADLKRRIRASPALQANETGWREDGLNGYVWCTCTRHSALLRIPSVPWQRGGQSITGRRLRGGVGFGLLGLLQYVAGTISMLLGASVARCPQAQRATRRR